MKLHYFDHAATTPLDPRVRRAMQPYLNAEFGNPSNLYELGRRAKQAIVVATEKITGVLKCRPSEIIFTGSATEADNLALMGVARANRGKGNKIIVTEVEHKGILAVAEALTREGFTIVKLPVGKNGLVQAKDLAAALDKKTILVSATCADSETGTIQPIKELGAVIKRARARHGSTTPYFHTDASQAAVYLDLADYVAGGQRGVVDLMTLSAHKLGGPKGVGALYVRQGMPISPITYGGGQQGRMRSGTENVPGIVGFGEAVAIAARERKKESTRVKRLRDRLERGIKKNIPKIVLNGHPTRRLPNFLNISILDVEGEAMLLYLDEKGICVNTGSACNSESLEPSYVLTALGNPYEYVHGSIRFTLGRETTTADVDYVLKELPAIVAKLRKISPLDLKLGKKEKISQPKAFVGGQTPHFLRKKVK